MKKFIPRCDYDAATQTHKNSIENLIETYTSVQGVHNLDCAYTLYEYMNDKNVKKFAVEVCNKITINLGNMKMVVRTAKKMINNRW